MLLPVTISSKQNHIQQHPCNLGVLLNSYSFDEMKGGMEVGAAAAERLFGHSIGRWLSAAIALGLVSALSAMILTGPRVF